MFTIEKEIAQLFPENVELGKGYPSLILNELAAKRDGSIRCSYVTMLDGEQHHADLQFSREALEGMLEDSPGAERIARILREAVVQDIKDIRREKKSLKKGN